MWPFSRKRKPYYNQKESMVTAVIDSGYPGVVSPEVSFEKMSKESYLKNVIAFGCINLISKAVSSVEWGLFKKVNDGDEERILKHPVLDVIDHPNPSESFEVLMEKLISFLLINGNSFVEKITSTIGSTNGEVKELYIHRPDRMTIWKDGLQVRKFIYKFSGQEVEWEVDPLTGKCNILHLKTFSPLDDWYGWGATMSAANELDMSNDSNEWNRSIFKNGCRPGTLMTISRKLSTEQFERFKQQIESKHTGPQNAGKTMIMDGVDESKGDIKIQPWGWSPKEIDFTESDNKTARRIAFAYGVPAMMVGIPGDNTYANFKEARESFSEDTVSWYLELLSGELNNWLFTPEDNLYLKPLLEDSPAMEAKKSKMMELAQKSDFLTLNEKRNLVGFPPIDGGDVILVGMGMMPFAGADAGDTPEDDEETEDAEKMKQLFSDTFKSGINLFQDYMDVEGDEDDDE